MSLALPRRRALATLVAVLTGVATLSAVRVRGC